MINRNEIESLITKAVQSHDSADALRFTQAACNAANAILTLANIEANNKNIKAS